MLHLSTPDRGSDVEQRPSESHPPAALDRENPLNLPARPDTENCDDLPLIEPDKTRVSILAAKLIDHFRPAMDLLFTEPLVSRRKAQSIVFLNMTGCSWRQLFDLGKAVLAQTNILSQKPLNLDTGFAGSDLTLVVKADRCCRKPAGTKNIKALLALPLGAELLLALNLAVTLLIFALWPEVMTAAPGLNPGEQQADRQGEAEVEEGEAPEKYSRYLAEDDQQGECQQDIADQG